MTNTAQLFLYLKFKGQRTNFVISPDPVKVESSDDTELYLLEVNTKEIFKFSLSIDNIDTGSAVIIDKILLNGNQLNHLDSFGIYKTSTGIKRTYGYMDVPGTYQFKIRYNALIQNYMTFLINP